MLFSLLIFAFFFCLFGTRYNHVLWVAYTGPTKATLSPVAKKVSKKQNFLLHLPKKCGSILKVLSRMHHFRVWRSLVSHLTGGQGAAGSSPVTRTRNRQVSTETCRFYFFTINSSLFTLLFRNLSIR